MSKGKPTRVPVVLVLGPQLTAVSGVSAHLRTLLASRLCNRYLLEYFQVGSEGRVETRGGRMLRLLDSPRRLAVTLRACRPALLHLNTSLNPGAFWRDLVYMLVASMHGVRVLYQVHGGALPQQFFGRGRLRQALLRRILALPDAIVVLARTELAAYRRFIPGQRLVLIPNAIDCEPYLSLPRRPTTCNPPAEVALRLIYLGRLVREKGVYELLQALANARARGTRVELTFAGTGPEEAQLRRSTAALDLAGAVRFAGPAFDTAKLQLLGAADVFVLPSYSEGMPCALLEGMAAGNAVIATSVGAIPDVVVAGEHGLLIPPRDVAALATAIATLAANRPRLVRMSCACRLRVLGAHSQERLACSFGATYSALLATQCAG